MNEKPEQTPVRPHKVLGRAGYNGDQHALCLTNGPFAEIVFSYTEVSFKEEDIDNETKLKIAFEYLVHDVPKDKAEYDKVAFEKELGDFLVELLYYGLEKDFLGFTTDEQNREDHPFKPDSQ